MNVPWMIEQLEAFIAAIDVHHSCRREDPRYAASREEILGLEPVVKAITERLPEVPPYQRPGGRGMESPWFGARDQAVTAAAVLARREEIDANLAPPGPELHVSEMHPRVWEAARALLEGGFPDQAVASAATAVDQHLKLKLARFNISGAELSREAFTFDPPAAGRPRLRFPGDRNSETWRARQGGARDFSAGCFTGIRNPAHHEHELGLSEQESLEQLAAFSVLARWIDECEVEVELVP